MYDNFEQDQMRNETQQLADAAFDENCTNSVS
jgi:hypothetical protein